MRKDLIKRFLVTIKNDFFKVVSLQMFKKHLKKGKKRALPKTGLKLTSKETTSSLKVT